MSTNNDLKNNRSRGMRFRTVGEKLMFFMLGGGIGASIALLFAPKPGRELRQDIADTAAQGCDKMLDAASRVKNQSLQYLEAAKEKGGDVLDLIAEKAYEIKDEIAEDTEKIGGIMTGAAKRVTHSVRSKQGF